VDAFLVESVCLELGRRAAGGVLVLPTVAFGLNRHHIDFPGTIHVEPEAFLAYCLCVTKSVAYHGFRKVLVVNGHGSNSPLVDLVARKTTLATESLGAAVNYFALAKDAFERVKETETWAHADEFETSLYLHLAGERVRMDRAVAGNDPEGRYMSSDSTSNYPVRFSDFWGRWTKTGVHGDPTKATAEKGKVIFEAAVTGLVELVKEFRQWPLEKRGDQHKLPVQSQIRW
jgi:creatinine amidohydrolase